MIELRDLTKTYGNIHAVRGLTFEIPKKQVVGFLGPNGAGKSTTMKMLTGYLAPTSGRAVVNGIDVSVNPIDVKRCIGYLAENNALYEDMIVLDFLKFVASMRNVQKSDQARAIRNAVDRCGIGHVLGKDMCALSKGYKQRVGIAQAILHDPEILILDEPTSGLDPNQIVEIRDLIKELGAEKTVMMSTHILSEAQSTCSRILIINEGKLVADDTPEHLASIEDGSLYVELTSRHGSPLDLSQVEDLLRSLEGVTKVEPCSSGFTLRHSKEDPRGDLFDMAVAEGWILMEMRRKEASLEETFRRLTME